MLPSSKVASKVISVGAHVATDVALKRVLVTVAAHVNGVEDIVRKVNVTVLTLEQGLLLSCGQCSGRCARLAVAHTQGQCICTTIEAEDRPRAAAPQA